MKVSVVITVFNEEGNISTLLESLFAQSKKADEIVIVDGGSSDKTTKIIKGFQRRNKAISLYVEKGNISHGRNYSIKKAKNEIIAQIDAGCVANVHWLKKLTEPFEDKSVDVVAGYYKMVGKSSFQKAAAAYYGVDPKRYDPKNFLPSGRSMAFRKKIWEKVGGYEEGLEKAGEDTLFNYRLVNSGANIVRVKDAAVDWEVPVGLGNFSKKMYRYAKGDAQSAIVWHPVQKWRTHTVKIFSIYMRYAVFLFFILGGFVFSILWVVFFCFFGLYLSWCLGKNADIVEETQAKLWLPVLQVVSDFSVMGGFGAGVVSRLGFQV